MCPIYPSKKEYKCPGSRRVSFNRKCQSLLIIKIQDNIIWLILKSSLKESLLQSPNVLYQTKDLKEITTSRINPSKLLSEIYQPWQPWLTQAQQVKIVIKRIRRKATNQINRYIKTLRRNSRSKSLKKLNYPFSKQKFARSAPCNERSTQKDSARTATTRAVASDLLLIVPTQAFCLTIRRVSVETAI